jgi:hypothetical protein
MAVALFPACGFYNIPQKQKLRSIQGAIEEVAK